MLCVSATRDVLNRMHKQGHTLSLEDLEEGDTSDAEEEASAVVLDLVTRYDELQCHSHRCKGICTTSDI